MSYYEDVYHYAIGLIKKSYKGGIEMKVKTLIKKLEALGDDYQNAEVTIGNPNNSNHFVPTKCKIDTGYCINQETKKCEVIIILNGKFK